MTSLDDSSPGMNAIVYCEGQFGKIDGKTANGLVRFSEKYNILGIIDSTRAGQDSGIVLGGSANNILVYRNIEDALQNIDKKINYYVWGTAPASGRLTSYERGLVLEAIHLQMNIVNGLHEFFSHDEEFKKASFKHKVNLFDIRLPPPQENLHIFTGKINTLKCPRVAIMGTDCAIGKRTTATLLNSALRKKGLHSILINTGQTGLIQGGKYGTALDAVPSQFCAGELESIILKACQIESPDIVLIEGQGSLGHPAYSTSSFILRGACPQAVILQHAPGRKFRCDFEDMEMPTLESEIKIIESFSAAKVIGIAVNSENLSHEEVQNFVDMYQAQLNIKAFNPLEYDLSGVLNVLSDQFPNLIPSGEKSR